jgi:hypothetical protein
MPRWYGLAAATVFSIAFWALLFFAAYGALQGQRRVACEPGQAGCAPERAP